MAIVAPGRASDAWARSLGPRSWFILPLWIAVALALAMALLSAQNAHPDEIFHVRAGQYYLSHWLPPELGSPDTLASYSVYGWSYLTRLDVSYFFAGLFGRLVSPFVQDPFVAFRLFNVGLLAALAFMCAKTGDYREIFLGLLVTPQTWYLFSYFNSDAFGLFLSLALCLLVTAPRSPLGRYLEGENGPGALLGLVGAAGCLGLLAIAKFNYLAVVGFGVIFLALRHLGLIAAVGLGCAGAVLANRGIGVLAIPPAAEIGTVAAGVLIAVLQVATYLWSGKVGRKRVLRLGTLAALSVAFFLPVLAYDRAIHGGEAARGAKERAVQEALASQEFKPSDDSAEGPTGGFRLRGRGIAYHEIFFTPWNWAFWVAMSASGIYGYMNIVGPVAYYVAIFLAYIVFLVHVGYQAVTHTIAHRNWVEAAYLGLAASVVGAIVFASSYASWAWDFQPQGRYLFPALPIAGAMIARYARLLHPRALKYFLLAAFSLSVASFTLVGLWRIPKAF